jgi:hypothetical protein
MSCGHGKRGRTSPHRMLYDQCLPALPTRCVSPAVTRLFKITTTQTPSEASREITSLRKQMTEILAENWVGLVTDTSLLLSLTFTVWHPCRYDEHQPILATTTEIVSLLLTIPCYNDIQHIYMKWLGNVCIIHVLSLKKTCRYTICHYDDHVIRQPLSFVHYIVSQQ